MPCQHRIGRSCQCHICLDYFGAHALIAALLAQLLELIMEIQNENRPLESSRRSAGPRMKPNDKKCFFAETQREMRIVRIATHAMRDDPSHVLVSEAFCSRPDKFLKGLFVEVARTISVIPL